MTNLESDPAGWYCYIAIHFMENDVLLAYCTGPPRYGHLTVTDISLIRLEDLYKQK
ncbi:MAG: hypothetical protein FWH27_14410 [Planctomycetaceae bacterium]|nr:hypothetical protein [Planctomycetaceae bacterium]